MDFFNSLLIRITLAVIGGIFYAFLTYLITIFLNFPYEFVMVAAVFVYLFYLCLWHRFVDISVVMDFYATNSSQECCPAIKQ